jgi:hypothetical protein
MLLDCIYIRIQYLFYLLKEFRQLLHTCKLLMGILYFIAMTGTELQDTLSLNHLEPSCYFMYDQF